MNTPIVSVIVPNYNHCRYLTLRIDSILNQSYGNFELILLDDNSSDNSREVLLSYQDEPRVKHVVFNEENSGTTFKQWDKGISLARGKYIWIAESDDFADSDFLKTVVAALDENPDAVLAFTGSQMVGCDGAYMQLDWDKFPSKIAPQTKYAGVDFLSKKMLWGNSVYNASMALFRCECFREIDTDYKQFRYCGDWLFWIGIAQQGSVLQVNRKLNFFRQHESKVSPQAEKEGLYFIEGGVVIKHLISLLHLSGYQLKVVAGRSLKRLLKDAKTRAGLEERAKLAHPSLFTGGRWSIFVYEFDKIFNFSGLQR